MLLLFAVCLPLLAATFGAILYQALHAVERNYYDAE